MSGAGCGFVTGVDHRHRAHSCAHCPHESTTSLKFVQGCESPATTVVPYAVRAGNATWESQGTPMCADHAAEVLK